MWLWLIYISFSFPSHFSLSIIWVPLLSLRLHTDYGHFWFLEGDQTSLWWNIVLTRSNSIMKCISMFYVCKISNDDKNSLWQTTCFWMWLGMLNNLVNHCRWKNLGIKMIVSTHVNQFIILSLWISILLDRAQDYMIICLKDVCMLFCTKNRGGICYEL